MDGGRARPDRACRPDPWEAVSSSKRSCAECPGGVLELIDRRGGRESFVSARDPVSQLLGRRGHQRPDRTRRQSRWRTSAGPRPRARSGPGRRHGS